MAGNSEVGPSAFWTGHWKLHGVDSAEIGQFPEMPLHVHLDPVCVAALALPTGTASRRSLMKSDGITALRSSCLLRRRFGGLADHVEHEAGLGQHRNVATIGLEGLRSHTLCDEALQVGLDGTVTASNDVPARFRFPSCAFGLLIEQVRRRRRMSGPNELLLLFGQIARKRRNTVRL